MIEIDRDGPARGGGDHRANLTTATRQRTCRPWREPGACLQVLQVRAAAGSLKLQVKSGAVGICAAAIFLRLEWFALRTEFPQRAKSVSPPGGRPSHGGVDRNCVPRSGDASQEWRAPSSTSGRPSHGGVDRNMADRDRTKCRPSTGAWIETMHEAGCRHGDRPSHGGVDRNCPLCAVAQPAGYRPPHGAWIETSGSFRGLRRSPLTQGRGSKRDGGASEIAPYVAPHAGAWIETMASSANGLG